MKASLTKDSKASLWFLFVLDHLLISAKATLKLLLVIPLNEMMSSLIVSDTWNAGHLNLPHPAQWLKTNFVHSSKGPHLWRWQAIFTLGGPGGPSCVADVTVAKPL